VSTASTKIRSSQSPRVSPGEAKFHHWFTDKRGIAERYGVSERTIDNWIRVRRIPHLKAGRVVRFNIARCDSALARFEVKEVAS
jgi:excisionase family DNA binding protein